MKINKCVIPAKAGMTELREKDNTIVMITKEPNIVLCHCEERSDAAISMYLIVV